MSRFFDLTAKSYQELLSAMHGKVNECITEVNGFTERISKRMDDFQEVEAEAKREHMAAMRQEFQDFIDIVNLKVDELKQNGTGGVTEEDKAEIVEDVLEALPKYTGQVAYKGKVEVK